MKGWIAAALIVVPLLIAATISYWPAKPIEVTNVVIPPPDVHGRGDISDLAIDLATRLADQLRETPKLKVHVAEKNLDANEAAAFDAVVITTLTEDAGIVQLNVQVIDPRTRTEIWSNAYQSPRQQFRDMVRVAGDALRRALD
jgi:hypothetical protein